MDSSWQFLFLIIAVALIAWQFYGRASGASQMAAEIDAAHKQWLKDWVEIQKDERFKKTLQYIQSKYTVTLNPADRSGDMYIVSYVTSFSDKAQMIPWTAITPEDTLVVYFHNQKSYKQVALGKDGQVYETDLNAFSYSAVVPGWAERRD